MVTYLQDERTKRVPEDCFCEVNRETDGQAGGNIQGSEPQRAGWLIL